MKNKRWLSPVIALTVLFISVTAVSALTYRVQWGDTLTRIAARFGVSVVEISQANGITNPNLIYAGQELEIPGTAPSPNPTPQPPPTAGGTYIVQRGDTLASIARRFNVTIDAIVQANRIANPDLIYVGQVLTIPGKTDTPPPPPPPSSSSSFALGGQTQSFGNKALMEDMGMTWVKIQHKWTPGDNASKLTTSINEAHSNGFKVLISITGAKTYPEPGSIDFTRFTSFLEGAARLGPDAIEIWNEMNIDFEWPAGEINPVDYVNNMLAPGYQAIKNVNSDILVISGALAPTGFDNGTNAWADDRYLAGMRAAGAASYADCIGVHHNAGATSPTATSGHPGGSHYSWYFRPTMDLYYNTFGGARQVCFTELGYLSGEGYNGLPANFSWASGTSVSEQSQWLAEAVSLSASSRKVRLLVVYNVDFTSYDSGGDPQAGYAMLRPDGSCPACEQVKTVMGK